MPSADRTILHPPSREPRSSGRAINWPPADPLDDHLDHDSDPDSLTSILAAASAASSMPLASSPPSASASASSSSPNAQCLLPNASLLLSRIAARNTDPEDLAREFGIRLDLLLDWMRAPETIARLNTLIEARQLNRQHDLESRRGRMLDSLEALHERAKAEDNPVEQRRTATSFLRFAARSAANTARFGAALTAAAGASPSGPAKHAAHALSLSRFPVHYRTRSREVRTVPILFEPPAILPQPDQPNPADSPAAVTLKVLHRLQDSDNPLPGDGLRTLFNHFTTAWRERIEVKSADDFARTDLFGYVQLIGHHSAILLPTQFPGNQAAAASQLAATQEVEFIDLDAEKHQLTLRFTRQSTADPWLINELWLAPPSDPNSHPTPGPAP